LGNFLAILEFHFSCFSRISRVSLSTSRKTAAQFVDNAAQAKIRAAKVKIHRAAAKVTGAMTKSMVRRQK
jgi:hypothetical protein